MRSFLRFLSRNKLYTFIEVVGLGVALAFVVFIATFVAGELGYDKELKGTENIYLGHAESFTFQSYTVGDVLKESYPEVEEVCRFLSTSVLGGVAMEASTGEETFPQNAIIADTSFFRFFTFPFVEGVPEAALVPGNAVVVSESFAELHFPDRYPLGQKITITVGERKSDLEITGVYKDIKRSVFPPVDIIYGVQQIRDMYPNLLREGNGTTVNFFRLAPGADLGQLQQKALEKLKESDILYNVGLFKQFTFSPFGKIHYGVCENHYPFVGKINLGFVKLFAAAGILLLVFALLNYISLTVAQIGFRAREMATRRLLGEQKWEIVVRYFKEALLLTVVSFALALLLIEVLGPYAKVLLGKEVDLMDNLTPSVAGLIAASLLVVSFVAGVVPALLVSRYRPIDVVKGEFAAAGKMTLGKSFIWVQNVVAITTLCVAFAMSVQLRHLLTRDTGYGKENIILVSGGQRGADYLEDELRQLPFVERIGHLQAAPADNNITGAGMTYNGEKVQLEMMYGDTTAFNMMGFAVMSVSGPVVPGDNTIWITEGTMKNLGLDYSTESVTFSNQPYGVCGVIRNFQKGNRTMEDCSSVNLIWQNMEYSEETFEYLRSIVVKVSGDEDEAVARLGEFYAERRPELSLTIRSQNRIYRQYFTTEENNLKLIAIFTVLVVMLSAMAMLAMSTYYSRQQARGWSVRKVFGCSRGEVYRNMVLSFLSVTALAALVALPLAWHIVGEWLSGYSYRIGNHWWLYALALLAISIVAVASISWQAVRLMNSDPIKELKKE
ncbi:MAG: ABC transporter permease [Bacteroidales bacterium]|nr:ABC transporter permease [Bacteroidales bacterium]